MFKQKVKAWIYKTTIRRIMDKGEILQETSKTKPMLETTEIKIIRMTPGKTLMDIKRSENIRRTHNVENI